MSKTTQCPANALEFTVPCEFADSGTQDPDALPMAEVSLLARSA